MSVQYPKHLTDWVKKGLSGLMGFDDDGQMTLHLLAFAKKTALSEYTQEVLGQNKAVEEFTNELWRRKTGEKDAAAASSSGPPPSESSGPKAARADLYGSSTNTNTASIKQKEQQQQQQQREIDSLGLGRNVKVKHQSAGKRSGGDSLQPSGRAACHCQATTHPLFTNCTACGKIVCQQEGEGPCYFCGSMVTAAGTFANDDFLTYMQSMEPADLVRKQEATSTARKAAAGESGDATADAASSSSTPAMEAAARESEATGLAKAQGQRDKLLQYAQEKKGSKILDDQNDWSVQNDICDRHLRSTSIGRRVGRSAHVFCVFHFPLFSSRPGTSSSPTTG